MAATFKTTAKGQQVVCGTPAEVKVGQVMVNIGTSVFPQMTTVEVLSIGRTFVGFANQTLVYGYLTAAPTTTTAPAKRTATPARSQSRGWAVRDESTGKVYQPRRGSRRACVTGGQCSSHGAGTSCGGHDCDGR